MQQITKQELFNLLGKENPLILDIGSFDGADAIGFADLGAHVHCFEPINTVKAHKNIVIHQIAIGATDKITVMHCSPHSQSNSMRAPKAHSQLFPEVKFTHKKSVEMVTLDNWYKQFDRFKRTPVIDLIWADVNGNEGDLIAGGENVLRKTRYLFIETSDKELFEGQITTDELLALLPGWEVLGMYNHMGNFGNILLKNGNGI